MSFKNLGFLESDDRPWVGQIRQRHVAWFALIDKLNRLAMSILLREVPKVPEELYVGTLYARAVTMFQGAVRLAEQGMGAESGALVRGCAETAIALGCVRRDKSFLGKLDEDYDKHRIALANDLLQRVPEDDPNLPPAERMNLRSFAAGLAGQYKPPHPQRINWADSAVTAGMIDLYMTVYRGTSGDAAHVGLKALERHLDTDVSGTIVGLRFRPEIEGIDNTLSQAIASLMHASEAKLYGLADATADAQLRSLAIEWSNLVPQPA